MLALSTRQQLVSCWCLSLPQKSTDPSKHTERSHHRCSSSVRAFETRPNSNWTSHRCYDKTQTCLKPVGPVFRCVQVWGSCFVMRAHQAQDHIRFLCGPRQNLNLSAAIMCLYGGGRTKRKRSSIVTQSVHMLTTPLVYMSDHFS